MLHALGKDIWAIEVGTIPIQHIVFMTTIEKMPMATQDHCI